MWDCINKNRIRELRLLQESSHNVKISVNDSRADVFAMPVRSLGNKDTEGFGIVFLEANTFGLPVVGGNSGGVPDAIAHNESGYLVDGEDIEAITERILFLLTHPDEAARLGEAGRQRVKAKFQWPTQSKKLAELLV